jgi:hypothetical protein
MNTAKPSHRAFWTCFIAWTVGNLVAIGFLLWLAHTFHF